MRKLVIAAILGLAPLSASVVPTPAVAQAESFVMSTAELMKATALDEVFTQFGASIAETPSVQDVPFNATMRRAWADASRDVFSAPAMHRRLARALDNKFSDEDYRVFATFYASSFGQSVTEAERRATELTSGRTDASPDQRHGACSQCRRAPARNRSRRC
jgi:hypothetical protein